MEMKKISIEKLFNAFDHSIELQGNNDITIVIGENGIGKTVILELIKALFNKDFNYLNEVYFEKLIIEFEDEVWTIEKEETAKENRRALNQKQYTLIIKSNKHKKNFKIDPIEIDIRFNDRLSRRNYPPFIRRVSPDLFEDVRDNSLLETEEVLMRYGSIPSRYFEKIDEPGWFLKRLETNKVYLIKTQRLLQFNRGRNDELLKTVTVYSKELRDTIQTCLAESTEKSSELDRTFPKRLVSQIDAKSHLEDTLLQDKWNNLEKYRKKLDYVGLIGIDKDASLDFDARIYENDVMKNVMSLYIEDSFEKLKVFEELAEKISLLINLINKRFKHKIMSISKDAGFFFTSSINKREIIPNDKLSSGEQNELVLFYELLFKSTPNSLILIDEPEISLHISWQNNLIDDLLQIGNINSLKMIIATHSPDIIGDNWGLTVSLKGKE